MPHHVPLLRHGRVASPDPGAAAVPERVPSHRPGFFAAGLNCEGLPPLVYGHSTNVRNAHTSPHRRNVDTQHGTVGVLRALRPGGQVFVQITPDDNSHSYGHGQRLFRLVVQKSYGGREMLSQGLFRRELGRGKASLASSCLYGGSATPRHHFPLDPRNRSPLVYLSHGWCVVPIHRRPRGRGTPCLFQLLRGMVATPNVVSH
jgi:hypothetical protein